MVHGLMVHGLMGYGGRLVHEVMVHGLMAGGPAVVPTTLPVSARPPDTLNWLYGSPPSRDGLEPKHGRAPVRASAFGRGLTDDLERAYVLE
jgi:hypothetical protein